MMSLQVIVLEALEQGGYAGMTVPQLMELTGLAPRDLLHELFDLVDEGEAELVPSPQRNGQAASFRIPLDQLTLV